MEYYNQTDRKARRNALVITVLLLLLLAGFLSKAVLEVHLTKKELSPVEIVLEEFEEFEEEPQKPPQEQESSTDVRYERTTAHVEEASIEQHEQTEGAKPETQTINTNALFKPVVGNVEELQAEGIEVILSTIPPFRYDPTKEREWRCLNMAIPTLAKIYGCRVYDFESSLDASDKILGNDYSRYGDHPTGEGGLAAANKFRDTFFDGKEWTL